MFVEILAFSGTVFFCLFHSITASNKFKSLFSLNQQQYRIFFNILAGITLIILSVGLNNLSSDSSHIIIVPLVQKSDLVEGITTFLSIIGLLFVAGSIVQTNPLKFVGLLAENPNKDFQANYFYKFSRHPMYFGALLLLVPNVFIEKNMVWIIQNIVFVSYFILGSLFEEKRLESMFTNYAEIMLPRGHLFPWKKSHFKVLLNK